jgi:hypothetical protein
VALAALPTVLEAEADDIGTASVTTRKGLSNHACQTRVLIHGYVVMAQLINDQPDTVAPLLEMTGICKFFPGVCALDNVSLTVFPSLCFPMRSMPLWAKAEPASPHS